MFAPVDQDAAALRLLAAEDQAEQGRLAAACLAQDADEFAFVDLQVRCRPARRVAGEPYADTKRLRCRIRVAIYASWNHGMELCDSLTASRNPPGTAAARPTST